jgi:transposase
MPDIILLSRAQLRRIEPFFPRLRGLPRVDDSRVVSGTVYVIRNGLQWKDAPHGDGPNRTLYNRFCRWRRLGVFERIFAALAGEAGAPDRLMIDATYLQAHRTAASVLKKGFFALHWTHQGWLELQAPRRLRRTRSPGCDAA